MFFLFSNLIAFITYAFLLSCSRACWGSLNWAVTPSLWPGSSRGSENFCEKSWPCSPDPLWHALGERSLSDSSAGRVLCMQQCLYFTSLPPYCGTSLGLTLAPSGSALCLGWSFSSCSESSSPLICLQTYLDPGVPGSSPQSLESFKACVCTCVCEREREEIQTKLVNLPTQYPSHEYIHLKLISVIFFC